MSINEQYKPVSAENDQQKKELERSVSAGDEQLLDFSVQTDLLQATTRDEDVLAAQAVLDHIEQIPVTEKTEGLSSEERELMEKRFSQLKEIIATEKLSRKTVEFLLTAEVSLVIAGMKPESYVQPKVARNLLLASIFKSKVGMIPQDLKQSENVLRQLGVAMSHPNYGEVGEEFKKEESIDLLYVYDKEKALKRMEESALFTTEELSMARADFVGFQTAVLNLQTQPIVSAYRCGVLYGYPLDDVNQYISTQKIGEKLEGSTGKKFVQLSAEAKRKLFDEYIPQATKEERLVIEKNREGKKVFTIRGKGGERRNSIGYYDHVSWNGVGDSVERDILMRKYQEVIDCRDKFFPV
ncbi:MAG: hypothetical protein PHH40_04645 [Candidatus Moranbacteria bacterium]|nr:hypothetical protein [Candidatus Moranbacteria bacterium]MDD3964476.1 hypothetical protein [Candidatus Moranbacteria bacterium]